jgi:8-oxo-dGTP pyrophosphatase MutT (NUDIX family)
MAAFSIAGIQDAVLRGGRKELHREGCRPAAVLAPFVRVDDAWHLLFTKRTEDLEHHKGQVSFPGGSLEEFEPVEAAALRETFEEIGIPAHAVTVLGYLNDIWTPSGYIITPVAGIIHSLDHLAVNPGEVSRVFTVPLSYFLIDSNAEVRNISLHGITRKVHFYEHDGETIWGATAMILRDLVDRLQKTHSGSGGRT